jgi:hypothetical protein
MSVAQIGGMQATELEHLRAAMKRDGVRGYWKEQLRLAASRNSPDPCWMGEIYAHLGDRQHTLQFLERGYLEHCRGMSRLNMEPLYDFVRPEPRFQAVLRKMRFPN